MTQARTEIAKDSKTWQKIDEFCLEGSHRKLHRGTEDGAGL